MDPVSTRSDFERLEREERRRKKRERRRRRQEKKREKEDSASRESAAGEEVGDGFGGRKSGPGPVILSQNDRPIMIVEREGRLTRGKAKRQRANAIREAADLGIVRYIPIARNFLERRTMEDWCSEVTTVLHKLGRSADAVSPMSEPTFGASGMGSRSAPMIIVYFPNEAILASALGPIKVFGFEAEILRLTAD
ncbi:hypothetical protein B9Z19DRAFT_1127583 [Tuber borchii]|uniref:Uncharacterized protein n=1 Tax=Tuber borchii TaxID=42251 RepID=A0A2T6ZR32_TUBBO|nr:hypothetical protein B9Z19DRAFT_1127583 [Tuber borchii]